MKKRTLALFLLLLTITGCKNAPEIRDLSQQIETEDFMYIFKPCSPDLLPEGKPYYISDIPEDIF